MCEQYICSEKHDPKQKFKQNLEREFKEIP